MLGARDYPERALVTGFFIICDKVAAMLLREIIADVIDVLGRPDLQNFVTTRAQQQLKLLHAADNWPRDKVEHIITVQNPDYVVRTALPAFWRKFDVIAPCTKEGVVITLPNQEIDTVGYHEADPRMVTGYRSQADTDYYYVAGDVLNIRASFPPQYIYVSFYKYPDLRSTEAVTWISESFPELVTYRVLFACYSMLGNMEQRNTYEQLFREAYQHFVSNAGQAGA